MSRGIGLGLELSVDNFFLGDNRVRPKKYMCAWNNMVTKIRVGRVFFPFFITVFFPDKDINL